MQSSIGEVYPDRIAIIQYRLRSPKNGAYFTEEWSIGCSNEDNEKTIRAHLSKWKPKAEFQRVRFKDVKKD